MAAFRTLEELDAKGRRVLVRVDFNVPMSDGRVTDATRLERGAVTLRELAEAGGRVVVLSHLGRPKGKPEPALSLRPIAGALGDVLGRPVRFAEDCIGRAAAEAVEGAGSGEVVLLENLRFHAGEEGDDPGFADGLAALGDAYVNDAFSASHRAHASITGLAERLPSYAGRLMQAELEALAAALEAPERPVAALVGGAKVSTKLDVLRHLLPRVDVLVIGGGMANTFLFAKGEPVGRSLCERGLADAANAIMKEAGERDVAILLPNDVVVAAELKAGAPSRTVRAPAVEDGDMILDIGPEAAAAVAARLEGCRTLLWNGPLGAFEIEPFDRGTSTVARKAAELTEAGRLKTVAGGGDTVAALSRAGALERFTYVSTAGGAFLEWLEGKELPGIRALRPR